MSKLIKYLILSLFFTRIVLSNSLSYADQDLISLFPIENYNQSISAWINSNDPDYDKALLSQDMQQKRFEIFQDHYFGSLSPWNADYINQILKQSPPNDIKSIEQEVINNFSNENKPDDQIGYGENFRPYSKVWIDNIENNTNLSQFNSLSYNAANRGIAIDNLNARALPTDDVHLYSYKLAGQGYPFDNLQMSALWAGTPVYIVGETRDRNWMLVITPDYIAWVKSNGIARANSAFINTWTTTAKTKLAAITKTQTSLVDEQGAFLLQAYVGSVFPVMSVGNHIHLLVAAADSNHNAVLKHATVSHNEAVIIPLTATPHNFATMMSTLIGRPYGWGSLYFYNDCSAELKSLFTPFGIWLPRHSSDQVTVGKMVDMSGEPKEKRLSYLMENGQRFLTIVYIGGHVVMYIGNYPNPKDNSSMAMTYQDIWGLSPNPPNRRAVIGQSVLFPMLLQYPEDRSEEHTS